MPQQSTGTVPLPHANPGQNLANASVTFLAPQATRDDLHPRHWIRQFPALSPRMTALMIEGDTELRYGSSDSKSSKKSKSQRKHAITAAAAAAAVRYGWTQDQFTQAMIDFPSAAGRGAREMSMPSAHRYLDKVWERAKTLVGTVTISTSHEDSIADLMALRDKIGSQQWRGTAAATALRVLMAHWHAARKAGGRMYTLSHREAAESAGCTARTAYVATTKRLTRWVRLIEVGTPEKGSTWCLLNGAFSTTHPTGGAAWGVTSNVSEVRNGELDAAVIERLMGLDAFAHRGLGTSSLKLLAALHLRDRQSVAELIDTAMVSQATAYRHLNRLAEYDLVAREDTLWKLTETASEALAGPWKGWNTVAAEIGTYGTAWRRQQAHKDQRAIWHGVVVPRLRERRMPDVRPVRGDEVDQSWRWGNEVIDPVTGEIIPDIAIASDGRLILTEEEPSYEELVQKKWLSERCPTFFSLFKNRSFC